MNSTQNVNMIPVAPSNTFVLPRTADIGRAKRTRAKRSCDMCRKKKTRCDADDRFPCTRCKAINQNCSFLVEQKKRGPATGYVEVLESRLVRMEKLLKNIASKDNDVDDEDLEPTFQCPGKAMVQPLAGEEDDAVENQVVKGMGKLMINDYQRTRFIGSSSGVHLLNQEIFCTNKKHHLLEETSWFLQKVNHEEEEHIIMKTKHVEHSKNNINNEPTIKRFDLLEDIPNMTIELADYLIHSYFTRVHTFCPIINKVQFLEQYYFQNPSPPDKYLLWAVAAIGARVSIGQITRLGQFNHSERQLMNIFDSLQEKTYRILNIVYKRAMISTVQALVLMSMYTEAKDGDEADAGHWFVTGMAIRMAQDMGLHRNCSVEHIPYHEVEIRRRVWYATYIMDRWVAAELGRPMTVLDQEFDVELPSSFEINTTYRTHNAASIPILLQEADVVLQEKRPIYGFFVNMISLSEIMGQVLVGFYSPRSKQAKTRNWDLVNKIDCILTNWKLYLPPGLQVNFGSQSFGTEASVLYMAYNCVLILLYRSFITPKDWTDNSISALKAMSVCTASAINVVNTVEKMDASTIEALPWNIAIYTVFQAAIIFLHNAKGESPFVSEQGREYLDKCAKTYMNDVHLRKTRIFKVLQLLASNYQVAVVTTVDTPSPQAASDDNSRSRRRGNSIISVQSDSSHNSFGMLMDDIIETTKNPSIITATTTTTTTASQDGYLHQNSSHVESSASPDTMSHICSLGGSSSTSSPGADPFTASSFNSIRSTKPEDMFITSISHGISKSAVTPAISGTLPFIFNNSSTTATTTNIPLDINMLTTPPQQQQQHANQSFVDSDLDKMLETLPLPYQQYDMASLTSEIPLWDLPSGVTWNDWEVFLKANPHN